MLLEKMYILFIVNVEYLTSLAYRGGLYVSCRNLNQYFTVYNG